MELKELNAIRDLIGVEARLFYYRTPKEFVIWNGSVRRTTTGRLNLLCFHRLSQDLPWNAPRRGMSMQGYTFRPI